MEGEAPTSTSRRSIRSITAMTYRFSWPLLAAGSVAAACVYVTTSFVLGAVAGSVLLLGLFVLVKAMN